MEGTEAEDGTQAPILVMEKGTGVAPKGKGTANEWHASDQRWTAHHRRCLGGTGSGHGGSPSHTIHAYPQDANDAERASEAI